MFEDRGKLIVSSPIKEKIIRSVRFERGRIAFGLAANYEQKGGNLVGRENEIGYLAKKTWDLLWFFIAYHKCERKGSGK